MSDTITLGGQDYPIAPLTMQQMRTVFPAFTRVGVDTPDGMAAQIAILQAAMSAADPKITVDFVDNLRGVKASEIQVAIGKIAEMTGIAKKPEEGQHPKGEAQAAETTSSGEMSTA